jgi:hypothetical protein
MIMTQNDKVNRGALGGRFAKHFIERDFDNAHFTIRALSRISD